MIELTDLTVDIPIFDAVRRSLKITLIRLASGGRVKKEARGVTVRALDHVNLTLREGDRIGLIGANGAGKSTLLRVLAGIYEPTSGEAHIEGRVSPLFDFSLGMNPESTGRENIYLRGLVLGLRRQQIRECIQQVEEFAELGDFLEMPVRTYSAGMRLRLAFAISTSIHPEILLLDEVIGAGDVKFQEKAKKRMGELMEKSAIVVVASHSASVIEQYCTRAILLDRGKVVAGGEVKEMLERYRG